VDSTGVYVAGTTRGTFPGQTGSGSADAFVRKYDTDGNEVWTRQFGTSSFDNTQGISVDSTGVYVAGTTPSTFPGQTSAGAFVRKYDADGNEVWTRQSPTTSFDDARGGIAVDSTGVYVAGLISNVPGEDAFVRKYDADGNEVWTRQLGTSESDGALGISVDSTGAYVIGNTRGGTFPGQTNAGGRDVFVAKLIVTAVIPVDIGIKPGSDRNSINCNNKKGVIAVAILTTEDFDATTVDHTTVTFEGASETHVDKKSGEAHRHEEDVDGDGDTDLVFHFRLGDTGLTCDSTEGTLIGETFDGQAIEGADAVRMVGGSA